MSIGQERTSDVTYSVPDEFWSVYCSNDFRPRELPPTSELNFDHALSIARIYIDRKTGEPFFNDEIARSRPRRFIRLCDNRIHIPRCTHNLEHASFDNDYIKYYLRLLRHENIGYLDLIDHIADRVEEMLDATGVTPDLFVTMPTRREDGTSVAVDAIATDCALGDSGHRVSLFFLVLHNDVEEPTDVTLADLAKLRNRKDCLVVDLHFGRNNTVGDARAIMADAVMRICFRRGILPSLVLADADITGIETPGTYAHLIDHLSKKSLAAVLGGWCIDIDTIKENKNFSLLWNFRKLLYFSLEVYGVHEDRAMQGAISAVNLNALVKSGGFMRTARIGEDRITGAIFEELFGIQSILILPPFLACVAVKGDREVMSQLEGHGRYDGWQEVSDQMRKRIPEDGDIDVQKILGIFSNEYDNCLDNLHFEEQLQLRNRIIALSAEYGLIVAFEDGAFVLAD